MTGNSLFAQEFSKNVDTYIQNNKHAATKIQLATKLPGQLTRIFDDMRFSSQTMEQAYQLISSVNVEKHLRDMAHQIATSLFNTDITDLNQKTKENLGKNNYQNLLLASGNKENLMNNLLQAVIASYGQVIAEQFKKTKADQPVETQLELTRTYNEKISAPMERYIPFINVTTLMRLEENTIDVESVKLQLTEFNNQLKDALKALTEYHNNLIERGKSGEKSPATTSDNMEKINRSKALLLDGVGKIEEQIERLDANPTSVDVKNAISRITFVCERIQQNIGIDLSKAVQEPVAVGIGEKILNTLTRILTFGTMGYKSSATEKAEARLPENLANIAKNHAMKATLKAGRGAAQKEGSAENEPNTPKLSS